MWAEIKRTTELFAPENLEKQENQLKQGTFTALGLYSSQKCKLC